MRLAHCNLHSNHLKSGITLVIPAVKLKQFICAGAQNTPGLNSNTNTTGSNRSQHRYVWINFPNFNNLFLNKIFLAILILLSLKIKKCG